MACKEGHEDIVKYLVEWGAIINKEDYDKCTPLIVTCYNGHIAIMKYLVELGANINKEDNDGYTPLFAACEKDTKI